MKWVKISDKLVLKILSKSPGKADSLAKLLESLKTLLLAINQGDWDRVCEKPELFLHTIEAAQNPDFLSAINSDDLDKIRQILTMLESAIEQCSVRKEQIAPLVKALTPAKANLDTR